MRLSGPLSPSPDPRGDGAGDALGRADAAVSGRAAAQARVPDDDALERPDRRPRGGSLDADRAPPALVSRGVEEREAGTDGIRPSVRAPDVQGVEERRARGAHVDDLVGRRPEQRLYDR